MLSIAGTHGGDSMAFARIGKALAVGLRSKLWESSCSRFFFNAACDVFRQCRNLPDADTYWMYMHWGFGSCQ
jgi:hypothetical protein